MAGRIWPRLLNTGMISGRAGVLTRVVDWDMTMREYFFLSFIYLCIFVWYPMKSSMCIVQYAPTTMQRWWNFPVLVASSKKNDLVSSGNYPLPIAHEQEWDPEFICYICWLGCSCASILQVFVDRCCEFLRVIVMLCPEEKISFSPCPSAFAFFWFIFHILQMLGNLITANMSHLSTNI